MRGDDEYKPIPLVSLILAVILIALSINLAFASGDEIEQELVNKNVISGSDSLGLGFGGASFDVDIGDCIGSYSRHWLFGIFSKQDLKENYWCHGFNFLSLKMYDEAAFVFCNLTSMSKKEKCEDGIKGMKPPTGEGTAGPLDKVVEEIEQHEQQVQEQLEAYQMQISDLTAQVQEKPPVVYRRQEPEPFLTDAKRAALLAVKEE